MAPSETRYHLAQYNIARLRHPLDDPATAGFVGRLDEVNALADNYPGFVWRLQSEAGNATDIDPYGDPMLIVNLSVWESIESLRQFAFKGSHLDAFRRRAEWFHPAIEPMSVLWWIEAGTTPTVTEAARRLETLRSVGPGPQAFTFGRPHQPPNRAGHIGDSVSTTNVLPVEDDIS